MDSKGLSLTKNAYFFLLTHDKKLLFVTFCDTTAEIGSGTDRTGRRTSPGRTDVKFEIFM